MPAGQTRVHSSQPTQRAARWKARVMCQAKLPFSVAEVLMHLRPVLIDDAPRAIAHRTDLPAGVALYAAGQFLPPVGQSLRGRIG